MKQQKLPMTNLAVTGLVTWMMFGRRMNGALNQEKTPIMFAGSVDTIIGLANYNFAM